MQTHLVAPAVLTAAAVMLAAHVAAAQDANLKTSVTIALPEEPPTLDPCAIVTVGPSRILAGNVAEGLTEREAGTNQLKPLLATAWKQTAPTTWEFTLRQGVKFHDGAPFNAQTAATSINRTFMPKLSCSTMTLAFGAVRITAAEPIDEYTIRITTNQEDPLLPFRASFLGMTSPNTGVDRQTDRPIGTGPYKFVRWDRGSSVTLQRDDNYWGAKPQLLTATYLFRGEDTVRAAMIETGEADIALALSPEYGNQKGAQSFPIPVSIGLRMDTQSAPLNDKRVRQAVDHAIDRQRLINAIWSGKGRIGTQVITPEVAGYNPDIKPTPYDVEAAKKLIAAAKADGVPVDRPIRAYNRLDLYPNADLFAQALAQQLNAIGLNVQIQNMEAAAWIERLLSAASPDRVEMVIDPHQNALGEASQSVNARFDSSQKRNRIPKGQQAQVDGMIRKAGATPLGEERLKLYRDLLAFLSAEVLQDSYIAYLESTIILGPKVRYAPNAQSHTVIRLSNVAVGR